MSVLKVFSGQAVQVFVLLSRKCPGGHMQSFTEVDFVVRVVNPSKQAVHDVASPATSLYDPT